MLYASLGSFGDSIKLLNVIGNRAGGSPEPGLVLWAYPEATASAIGDWSLLSAHKESLEPVTSYENGFVARRTDRLPLDLELLESLQEHEAAMVAQIDSVCLYPAGAPSWVAAAIGHEAMGLVRDPAWLGELRAAGLSASERAPSWW